MNLEIYPYDAETLRQMLEEADAVESTVRESVREALLMHKRLGNPVASCENGKVVWIPPDQILVDDDDAAS